MELVKINEFLAQKSFAIVGVSTNKNKFGNAVYKELKTKEFNIFPVHLTMEEFQGDKCYPSISALSGKIDAVIVVAKPEKAIEVIKEAHKNNIKYIWLQQGAGSKEAIEFAESNGISVISKRCIFMFVEKLGFIHKCHRGLSKLFGKYPK